MSSSATGAQWLISWVGSNKPLGGFSFQLMKRMNQVLGQREKVLHDKGFQVFDSRFQIPNFRFPDSGLRYPVLVGTKIEIFGDFWDSRRERKKLGAGRELES